MGKHQTLVGAVGKQYDGRSTSKPQALPAPYCRRQVGIAYFQGSRRRWRLDSSPSYGRQATAAMGGRVKSDECIAAYPLGDHGYWQQVEVSVGQEVPE